MQQRGETANALMEADDGLVAAVDRALLERVSGNYRTSADEYRQTPNLLAVGMGFVASPTGLDPGRRRRGL